MFKTLLTLVQPTLRCSLREIRRNKSGLQFLWCLDVCNRTKLSTENCEKLNKTALTICRNYAKGREVKKDKKKKVQIDDSELKEVFDIEKLLIDFKKPAERFKEELTLHASVRTSHGVIEGIKVDYEGETYTLQDLAEIAKKNPKMYVLSFESFPQVIPKVIETLQSSELKLNVQQEGTRVFVPIPKVTMEHRQLLAKKCKAFYVTCKDEIRNVQFKYTKKLKSQESVSDDLKFRVSDQLKAIADKEISLAEEILKEKQNDLLKVE